MLEHVDASDLRTVQAVEVLGVSECHVWRLPADYRARCASALAHGNRGAIRSYGAPVNLIWSQWLRRRAPSLRQIYALR